MIKIATILGTVRPGNYTGKALALVQDEIKKNKDIELDIIDPSKLNLALPGQSNNSFDSDRIREMILNATGIVISTPEYHGSFSATVKLIIENLGFPSSLATKPVALLGVAAGQIGAIKSLEQLRSVCSHVGAIVLPGPVSVANVRSVFDEDGNCLDEKIEKRVRSVATSLIDFIHNNICPRFALEQFVREEVVI
ncbi:NAD(P)H-dependent oxidoreductase [candidate division KSB1 bacterium]|nr:NAD(P)H-dependent oxidoreductase [candidate division KSB1 bacterium]